VYVTCPKATAEASKSNGIVFIFPGSFVFYRLFSALTKSGFYPNLFREGPCSAAKKRETLVSLGPITPPKQGGNGRDTPIATSGTRNSTVLMG
jgi:hypothetical protein